MAQSVEHPTLNFGSSHDPRVMGWSPTLGSALSVDPAWDSLSLSFSLSPSAPLPYSCPLSLKKKKNWMSMLKRHCIPGKNVYSYLDQAIFFLSYEWCQRLKRSTSGRVVMHVQEVNTGNGFILLPSIQCLEAASTEFWRNVPPPSNIVGHVFIHL